MSEHESGVPKEAREFAAEKTQEMPSELFDIIKKTNQEFPQDVLFTAVAFRGLQAMLESKTLDEVGLMRLKATDEQIHKLDRGRLRGHAAYDVPKKTREDVPEMDEFLHQTVGKCIESITRYASYMVGGGLSFWDDSGVPRTPLTEEQQQAIVEHSPRSTKKKLLERKPVIDIVVDALEDPLVQSFVEAYKRRVAAQARAGEEVTDERAEFRRVLADAVLVRLQQAYPDKDWEARKDDIIAFVTGGATT